VHPVRAALLAGFAWLVVLPPPASAIQWCSQVSASSGIAACGDIQARDIIVGLTPAEVRELMRELFAQDSAAVQKVEELSKRLGVTEPALKHFLSDLGQGDVPIEELPSRLAEIATHHKDLLARLEATNSTDPEVQRLKAQAREALDIGDFARTEELLNQAKARDLSAIEQMRATMERMQAALDARQLSAAEAAAENGDLMMTRIRYADAARYYAEAVGLTPEKYAEQFSRRLTDWAMALSAAGDYQRGLDAASRALALDEARLPGDDFRLVSPLNTLAELYRSTGRWAEAEPLYRRVLSIWQKLLALEHPDIATIANNFAELYRATGRYGKAEPLYQRALEIREKVLGPEHPAVAQSANNLGRLYHALGRYGEAEPLFRRALAIVEKALGPEHPSVATAANDLAELYRDTGRWAEAEPLFRRALALPWHVRLSSRRFQWLSRNDHMELNY
jgi:tetratricopeptide (TPR) repeat protein